MKPLLFVLNSHRIDRNNITLAVNPRPKRVIEFGEGMESRAYNDFLSFSNANMFHRPRSEAIGMYKIQDSSVREQKRRGESDPFMFACSPTHAFRSSGSTVRPCVRFV